VSERGGEEKSESGNPKEIGEKDAPGNPNPREEGGDGKKTENRHPRKDQIIEGEIVEVAGQLEDIDRNENTHQSEAEVAEGLGEVKGGEIAPMAGEPVTPTPTKHL